LNVKVWLTSGKFESSISVPLFASQEQRDEFVDAWFEMMIRGIRMGSKL
jgi:hypothetical protein